MKPVLRWARAELCAQGSSSYLAVSLETTNSIAVDLRSQPLLSNVQIAD